ncbi:helix-turn-helix domain-containing protein [Microbulbifer epialgicus]|uniref:Helix-turn-helix domain-containing protein n=1 Tax=Microbulbifer epialgicus TaxID=393907 RepID=A0ABV4NY55_9GAMM
MDALLFNFHDIVLLMTSYQCALFALLLLVIRRDGKISNKLLALFLFSQAAIPVDILISFGAGFRQWSIETSPNLFYVFGFAFWLEGPLLLWYTRSLIYKKFRVGRQDLWFLAPFIAYAVYEYFAYFRFDNEVKTALLLREYERSLPLPDLLLGLLRELIRVLFGTLCLLEVRRCRRRIRDTFSSIEKIDFTWLLVLLWGFLLVRIWAVLINIALTANLYLQAPVNFSAMGLASNYAVFILVSAMIFFSLGYSSMFEGFERGENKAKGEPESAEDGCKSTPPVDMGLVARIEDIMQREKPFLVQALTLEQLSSQLQIPRRSLSQTINRHYQCNFFEFINRYRIDEAKRLLRDPDSAGLTVLEIMLESGFNTKATFNSFFRKVAGMTPTEYRKLSEDDLPAGLPSAVEAG